MPARAGKRARSGAAARAGPRGGELAGATVMAMIGVTAAGVRGRAVEEVEVAVEGRAGVGRGVFVGFVDGVRAGPRAGSAPGPRAGPLGRRRAGLFGASVQAVHGVELLGVFVDVGFVAVVAAPRGRGFHEKAAAGGAGGVLVGVAAVVVAARTAGFGGCACGAEAGEFFVEGRFGWGLLGEIEGFRACRRAFD